MKLMGYDIATDLLFHNDQGKLIINTINPHSYCVANEDAIFKKTLKDSDVLLPDGIGIVWAVKMINKKNISKIAGADLHVHLLERANTNHQKVFYLGSAVSTLALIESKINNEYPNIVVKTYSPPYKPEFSIDDSREMIEVVNAFKPDILFVGMTAPKQEKWVHQFKDQLDVQIITCIGAVFDFYAGTVQRSGPIWIKLGLEWLPRLIREPKRLWKRNLISTPKFILEVFSFKLRGKGILKFIGY